MFIQPYSVISIIKVSTKGNKSYYGSYSSNSSENVNKKNGWTRVLKNISAGVLVSGTLLASTYADNILMAEEKDGDINKEIIETKNRYINITYNK